MENFYKALLDDDRMIVFVKDEQLNVVFANKAFLELYAPDVRPYVVGMASANHFLNTEAKVFQAEDIKAFQTGFSEIVEEITDYTGRVRILHSRKIRYQDKDGRPLMLGLALDVSDLSQREKALARSNLMLENFAAIAAHDLRSPLGAMQTSIQVVMSDADTVLSPRAKRYFGLMETSLQGLIEQVSTLLREFKNRQHDKLKDDMCDVSLLLEEVRFNLSNLIDKKNARVLSETLPKIQVNKAMFRQLIHNLIENSLKYYRKNGHPVIVLRYQNMDGLHHFALEDNGDGMPSEIAETLFDLGVHQSAGMDANMGHGIGLALCRDVVTMHGGRIWVDVAYKDGCRICFEMPEHQPALDKAV